MSNLLRSQVAVAVLALAVSSVAAQRGPAPDPLVRENVTVRLAPHT